MLDASRRRSLLAVVVGLVIVLVTAIAQRSVEPGFTSPPGRDGNAVAAVRELLVQQGVPGQQHWRNMVVTNRRGGWTVFVWTGPILEPNLPLASADFTYDVLDCVSDAGYGVTACLKPAPRRGVVDPAGVSSP
jgi:hypothetical protein